MMSLFPELQTSNDIHFGKTSKKGQRRVCQGHSELKALDVSLDIQSRVDNRIKSNMREFATARLNTSHMKEKQISQRFCRQKRAAMEVRAGKSWLSRQHEIILELLYPASADA